MATSSVQLFLHDQIVFEMVAHQFSQRQVHHLSASSPHHLCIITKRNIPICKINKKLTAHQLLIHLKNNTIQIPDPLPLSTPPITIMSPFSKSCGYSTVTFPSLVMFKILAVRFLTRRFNFPTRPVPESSNG